MSKEIRIGELFVLGFQGPVVPGWLVRFEKQFGLGGVIVFDYSCQTKTYENNVISRQQLKQLCNELNRLESRPLIMVDQEGGKVRRLKEKLGFKPLPSAKAMNTLPPSERTKLIHDAFAELRELGFGMNLAPVVDLDTNPNNPDIGKVERSYSAVAEEVQENALIVCREAKALRLALCLKHYPGIGGATVNSHEELMDLSGVRSDVQQELFFSLLPEVPGQAILLSHGMIASEDSQFPVSVSPVAVGKLRKRAENALLLTDDLQMQGLQERMSSKEACAQALRAGVDLSILGNNMLNEEMLCESIALHLEECVSREPICFENARRSCERVALRKKEYVL